MAVVLGVEERALGAKKGEERAYKALGAEEEGRDVRHVGPHYGGPQVRWACLLVCVLWYVWYVWGEGRGLIDVLRRVHRLTSLHVGFIDM